MVFFWNASVRSLENGTKHRPLCILAQMYMQKKEVCLGMIGAGRATELHMNEIHRYSGVPVRCKTIVARRWEQVVEAKNKYGFETATLNVKELLEDP